MKSDLVNNQASAVQTKTVRRGTFCVVIDKHLVTSSCPLPRGSCIWKHAITGVCTYDPQRADVNAADLAKIVGRPLPTEDQFLQIKSALLDAVRNELKAV